MGIGSFLFGSDGQSANNVLQPSVNQYGNYAKNFAGNGANDAMATGSTTGSQYATSQVMNNPILGQLFGKGGTLSDSVQRDKDLNTNGFALTGNDRDALGQVSGDIARQSGAQEQGLAKSLSSRGFGNSGSGIAGAAFSGAEGNKFEQLAKAQTGIAQQRVQNTQQRIQANNQLMTSLGGQAEGAINDQFGRQMSGAKFGSGVLQQDVENNAANQNEINEQFAQQQQTKSSGMLSKLAQAGLTAAGTAFGGPLGGMAGGALGGALFGGSGGGGGGSSGGGSVVPANMNSVNSGAFSSSLKMPGAFG